MKNTIRIETPLGVVELVPTGPEIFSLEGESPAVDQLMEACPVLGRTDNQISEVGDVFVHLLYLEAQRLQKQISETTIPA